MNRLAQFSWRPTPAALAIRREAKALVVFAELADHCTDMPATLNGVERTMGMIADRWKRKWARWGGGLRDQAVMLLVRDIRRGIYHLALRGHLGGGPFA